MCIKLWAGRGRFSLAQFLYAECGEADPRGEGEKSLRRAVSLACHPQPSSLSRSPIPVTAWLALAFHVSQLIEASAWGSLLWIFPTKYRLIKATVQILAYSPIGQARVS